MAVQVTFEGDVIGDEYIKSVPIDLLLSPPAKRVGLYQPLGAINADSRNYLYGRQIYVMLNRDNPVLLSKALLPIMELKGRTGDIEITFGGDTETLEQWTIDDVVTPNIPEGFGGKYVPEVIITAYGNTRPTYS